MAFLIRNLEMLLKASDSPRFAAELVFRSISKLRIKNSILARSVASFVRHVGFLFARWTYFSTQSGFSRCANGNDLYLCEVE
jgi:hypothetical protein